MEGHVFHFTVTVLYTTTCCLIPKRKVPSACNDQHLHYSFQCRDTALFFFPSFTSVYPGNIGQMLTNRSQANQRVQEIHHNIKTGVLRDVSIDILVHEEKINTHEAEDYNDQYGIKTRFLDSSLFDALIANLKIKGETTMSQQYNWCSCVMQLSQRIKRGH